MKKEDGRHSKKTEKNLNGPRTYAGENQFRKSETASKCYGAVNTEMPFYKAILSIRSGPSIQIAYSPMNSDD